jgi:hypothetical protein
MLKPLPNRQTRELIETFKKQLPNIIACKANALSELDRRCVCKSSNAWIIVATQPWT